MENLDEIVAQKKGTLQLRPFDSAVEFGTLDDADEPAFNMNQQLHAIWSPEI
jgi:hypothetical protein